MILRLFSDVKFCPGSPLVTVRSPIRIRNRSNVYSENVHPHTPAIQQERERERKREINYVERRRRRRIEGRKRLLWRCRQLATSPCNKEWTLISIGHIDEEPIEVCTASFCSDLRLCDDLEGKRSGVAASGHSSFIFLSIKGKLSRHTTAQEWLHPVGCYTNPSTYSVSFSPILCARSLSTFSLTISIDTQPIVRLNEMLSGSRWKRSVASTEQSRVLKKINHLRCSSPILRFSSPSKSLSMET